MPAIQLEPMVPSQLVDESFRLYKKNFIRFIAIIAVIQIPLGLLTILAQSFLARGFDTPEGMALFLLFILVWILLAVLGNSLCHAALMKSVSEYYLGREVTVGEAYRYILPKLLTIIAASILLGVILFFGMLFCFVPGIIFYLWFCLTIQAIILEDCDPVEGLKRSKQLVSGNLSRTLVLAGIVVLITVIVQLASQLIAYTFVMLLPLGEMPSIIVQHSFPVISGILIQPVNGAAFILLYYDLRIRKEGFDLEMRAKDVVPGGSLSNAGSPNY